jgi:hypothetical protein
MLQIHLHDKQVLIFKLEDKLDMGLIRLPATILILFLL